jgi:acetyl esterase
MTSQGTRLDTAAARLYDELAETYPMRRSRSTPVAELRRLADKQATGGPAMHHVADHWAPGPSGPVRLRIYRPAELEVLPALLWIHGGGWVFGSIEGTDVQARELAESTGCAVVSLDYRKAPEHPYPAAIDDVSAAAAWVAGRAPELGLDPRRLAIGGISAGGNLAAAACLVARDRGGPSYVLQLLVASVLDIDPGRPSMLADADPTLAAADVAYFVEAYLGECVEAPAPYAVPMTAPSLAGLPPAVVLVGDLEPIADGAQAYAERLPQEGTAAVVHRFPGVGHAFFGLPVAVGEEAFTIAANAVRRALGVG